MSIILSFIHHCLPNNDKYSKIIPKIFKIDKDLTVNDFDNESRHHIRYVTILLRY